MKIKAAAGAIIFLIIMLSSGCHSSHLIQSAAGRFLTRTVVLRGRSYCYTIYLPPGYSAKKTWPVILSLHGAGECGTDGVAPSQDGLGVELRVAPGRYPCIVVFPQTPYQYRYWTSDFDQALAALNKTVREFHGDPKRLYLTGYSMGGAGAWFLAARHPGKFAALVPICGRITVNADRARDPLIHHLITECDPYAAVAMRIGRTAVWVFHGKADPIVPLAQSRHMVAALKAHAGNVRFTEYPGIGHDAWDTAYADPNLPRWLLAQHLAPTRTETH